MRRPRNVGSMTPSRRVLCLQCWARFFRRRRICLVCLGSFLDLFLFPICSLFLFATVALCPSSAALLFGLRRPDLGIFLDFRHPISSAACVAPVAPSFLFGLLAMTRRPSSAAATRRLASPRRQRLAIRRSTWRRRTQCCRRSLGAWRRRTTPLTRFLITIGVVFGQAYTCRHLSKSGY